MSEPRRARRRPPVRQHRREVLTQVFLPMLGVTAVFTLLMILMLAALGERVSMVGDFMLTCCFLVPTVVLCLLPYALLVALAAGLSWGNTRLVSPLGRLRSAIIRALQTVQSRAPTLAKPLIGMQTRLARWEHLTTGPFKRTHPSPEEE